MSKQAPRASRLQRQAEAAAFHMSYKEIMYMPGGWLRWESMDELSKQVIANDLMRQRETLRTGPMPTGSANDRRKRWSNSRMR